jgi:hypothetical protein
MKMAERLNVNRPLIFSELSVFLGFSGKDDPAYMESDSMNPNYLP